MKRLNDHTYIALQFSGGKDSLACLYLLKPYWNKITVMWCNTGDAFPETIEQMEVIRNMVPKFLEVRSNQPLDIAENGIPVQVLPITNTGYGRLVEGHEHPLMQSYSECCRKNLWEPNSQAVAHIGATLIIRGQRNSDHKKSPVRSGDVVDGIEYFFPLEDWSEDQVFSYLEQENIPLPKHYGYFKSSLDCMHCTAYLDEGPGKMSYMREFHPDVYLTNCGNLDLIKVALYRGISDIERTMIDAK